MIRYKLIFLLLSFYVVTAASAQNTFPVNDVAHPKTNCYAFTNATIVKDAQTLLSNATMIIRNGLIEAVGTAITVPSDAIVLNCRGKYIYPSFIDMYSDYGMEGFKMDAVRTGSFQNSSATKGAYGWNQAIRSEWNAAERFVVNEPKAKDLRNTGFGTVLTHPMDGISRGTGTVVTLASEKENKIIVKEKAAAHYAFSKGSSTQDYPGSLMGSIALLRQNFLDAAWYKNKPAAEGVNLSLQSFLNNQNLPQIFEAGDKWNDLRADKVGDEFGVQYIIRGGGNEYQRLQEIGATNASFIIPVNFPEAMDMDDAAEARLVSFADLKHWEMAPYNLGMMEKANINFAITAHGLKETSNFLNNIRKAIASGLTEKKAMEALTKIPATLLGIYDKTGSLETGKLANFLITSGPVFNEKTTLYQNWIQGIQYTIKDDKGKELKGKYLLRIDNSNYELLVNNSGRTDIIHDGDTGRADITINDRLLKINFTLKNDNSAVNRLNGVANDSSWSGTGEMANGKWINWTAQKAFTRDSDDSVEIKKQNIAVAPAVIYPFTGYGTSSLPLAKNYLIKNSTVWTGEENGKLFNTDVLIKNGKIAAVGKNLQDANATVIDGTGKHLTAGIIDEHSHIAITGGVNECSQSVTAETRVADVLDPEDISIYRCLAGGVTSSHLLHGSCNTIGGQTQLVKLRWGMNAEQMKFSNWDPFIKFALGENVKRSSTPANNRFPDTRMGVEEVLTDAFTRAKDYQKMGPGKRKDLELETLVEILNKKRFITCHSYVQSEINSMIKVADKFGFTLNTFTHILEGYKVADKMKKHGAAASTFSDWWTYKMEVADAIPQNAYLMQQAGLRVAINSDDDEMATRLNQEAAKSVKYAGMSELDAWKMVTINPAMMLHVADRTGSIKVGKDADLVVWSDEPLSIYAKAEKTFVDGIIYFDREMDALLQQNIAAEKRVLVQKMIAAKKGGEKTVPAKSTSREHHRCDE